MSLPRRLRRAHRRRHCPTHTHERTKRLKSRTLRTAQTKTSCVKEKGVTSVLSPSRSRTTITGTMPRADRFTYTPPASSKVPGGRCGNASLSDGEFNQPYARTCPATVTVSRSTDMMNASLQLSCRIVNNARPYVVLMSACPSCANSVRHSPPLISWFSRTPSHDTLKSIMGRCSAQDVSYSLSPLTSMLGTSFIVG